MIQDKFPKCVLIDFGHADVDGFPEISTAIAFREPLGDIADAFSAQESCRYIREDVVKELVEVLEEVQKIISPLPENALGSGRAHITHPDGECGEIEWSNRGMVLDRINKAITKAKGVS